MKRQKLEHGRLVDLLPQRFPAVYKSIWYPGSFDLLAALDGNGKLPQASQEDDFKICKFSLAAHPCYDVVPEEQQTSLLH